VFLAVGTLRAAITLSRLPKLLQDHPIARIESRQVAPGSTKNHANIFFFQLGTFGRGKAKVEAMQKVIAEARRTQAAH
jgi:hypothetical protein